MDKVLIYADGVHDDTDAAEKIMNGLAEGVLPDGSLLSESGGTILITRAIDLTGASMPGGVAITGDMK